MLLSLLSDILSFLTAHLRVGYELTRLVYWSAGVKLGGGLLWGVFRGMFSIYLFIFLFDLRKLHVLSRKKTQCAPQPHRHMVL